MAAEGKSEGKVNALGSLETIGVSLVKRGANKRMFALTKSREGNDMKIQDMLKTVIDEGAVENQKKLEAVIKAENLGEKEAAALEAIVKMRDAFKDKPGLAKALFAVAKEGMPGADDKEDNSTTTMARKAEEEEEKKKKARATKARKTAKDAGASDDEAEDAYKKALAQALEEGEDEEEEESRKAKKALAKSLDGLAPGVKGHLEAIFKSYEDRLEAAKEQTQELQRVAKAETHLREEREWISKAEKHLTHVPNAKPSELAKKLHKMAKHDPEAAQEQFELLKRSSDAIRKSAMFRDVGTGNTGEGGATAYDEIQSKVEQMVLKSEGKMTREQATVKVMNLFPDLYARADQEHQDRADRRGR